MEFTTVFLGAAGRSLEDPWGNFQGTWEIPTKIKGTRADVTTGIFTALSQLKARQFYYALNKTDKT